MIDRLHYLGNKNLKAAGVQIEFEQWQIEEFIKCSQDPLYFIENYAKIVSLDKGIVNFDPFPYQRRIIEAMHNNQNTIGKLFRQAGKSTIVAAYFAWYVLFNDNKTAVILANKATIAKEIFYKVQFMIENLPFWLQQGVVEWNKTSFALENGSRCIAAATSASAVRGMSINMLLLDEFAHLKPNLAEEFTASVFPTISSAKTSKLIIISTPNGLNHYHKLWVEAENGTNGFKTVTGRWQEHPLRDSKWAEEQRQKLGEVKYRQEIECTFEGSSYTLVDGVKLSTMPIATPIFQKDGLEVFKKPEKDHNYVCIVDVSRGRHQDFSAFTIIDVTQTPYDVVVAYKNNTISTLEIPHIIFNTMRQYNNAFLLIEVNDLGQEVANIIYHEYEYENVYFSKGNEITQVSGYPGIRTTKPVKSLGCSVLKDLIEKDQLLLNSHNIIQELSLFVVQKRGSYGTSDPTVNDDLTTTLWLFSWLTKQSIFSEVTNSDVRKLVAAQHDNYVDQTLTPFGFHNDGQIVEENTFKVDKDIWQLVS